MNFIKENDERCNQFSSRKRCSEQFKIYSDFYQSNHKIIKNKCFRINGNEFEEFLCYSIVKK